ncbi:uncharacterized protein LOC142039892 [Buteo buteo]|uniref:uncharacterized protein LOC142039892 n=1 Tax=Buteo buteo TaxID=30397 RepID=UPI003EB876AF
MERPPPGAAAAGPRAEPSAPVHPSRLSELETVKPTAPAIDAESPAVAAAGEKQRHWRGVIKDAIIERTMLQTFPVITLNGQKKWEAFDWKVIEKLKNAVSQYEIKSALAHQILRFIFSADTLIPQDIKQIARLVSEPSKMLVFFRQWEKFGDREQTTPQQTDPLWGVTTQMLMSIEPFTSGNAQLQRITEVHYPSQILAYQAFLTIPDNMQSHTFTQVKQEHNEPFAQFLYRLHRTIYDHHDMNEGMKENMQLHRELQRNARPVRHPWSSVLTVANMDTLKANVQLLLRKMTIPPRIQEEGKLYTAHEENAGSVRNLR